MNRLVKKNVAWGVMNTRAEVPAQRIPSVSYQKFLCMQWIVSSEGQKQPYKG